MLNSPLFFSLSLSDSHRIQTYNLLIRSQMLYSVELASHYFLDCVCKGIYFFGINNLFCKKFDLKIVKVLCIRVQLRMLHCGKFLKNELL